MYTWLYGQINAMSLIIVGFLWFRLRRDPSQQESTRRLNHAVVALGVILALDMAWVILDGREGTLLRQLNILVNCAYLTQSGVITYCWLEYVQAYLGHRPPQQRWIKLVRAMPLMVLGVMCIVSLFTGALFSVDSGNVYHRGPLHFLQPLLCCWYLLLCVLHIVLDLHKNPQPHRKQELRSLLMVFALPSLGALIGLTRYGLPMIWSSATLSLLLVFLNLQSYQISTDALTGLNNRRQFDLTLQALAGDPGKSQRLTLLLMDINRFKQINDTYGHYEGDQALIAVSAILKELCRNRDYFLARYGGDEFAILLCPESDTELRHLTDELKRKLEARNAQADAPYPITMSVGAESYRNAGSIPQLIVGADQALYAHKSTVKAPQRTA